MRNAWAVVVLVLGALASVVILAVTHADSLALTSVIAATVVPTVSVMLVGHQLSGQVTRVDDKVASVDDKVNGRMSELIANQVTPTPTTEVPGG